MRALIPLFAAFVTGCLSANPEVLPACPDTTTADQFGKTEIEKIFLPLDDGKGLHIESSCVMVDGTKRTKLTSEEFLYSNLIQYEALTESDDKKEKHIIVVNDTKGFETTLSKDTSLCNKKSTSGSDKWDKSSLDLLETLGFSGDFVSLAWILQTASDRTWYKILSESDQMTKLISCSSSTDQETDVSEPAFPKLQMNFLQTDDAFDHLGNLLEVMVAVSDSQYHLFTVYQADYITKEEATIEQLVQNFGLFQPPDGELCDNYALDNVGLENAPEIKYFPDQMSLSSEAVNFETKKVQYTSEFYNFNQDLARIELHSGGRSSAGNNYVSPRFANEKEKDFAGNDPVTLIHDFKSGQVFVIDLESDFCEIKEMKSYLNSDNIPGDMHPEKCNGTSLSSECVAMFHPSEIYYFNDYIYAGKCLSQSQVPGLKFIFEHTAGKKGRVDEVCFADGTWSIGSIKKGSDLMDKYSIPFYIKRYDKKQPRTAPDFEPYVSQVVHFYDVEFRPPDASYFDVSHCFAGPDQSRHFVLMSRSKTLLCLTDDCSSLAETPTVPLFWKLPVFTAELRKALSDKLEVAPIRIYDLFVEEPNRSEKESEDHDIVIGFGLLDINSHHLASEQNQLSFKEASKLYRPIEKVEDTMTELSKSDDGFKLDFIWPDLYMETTKSENGEQTRTLTDGTFKESVQVDKIKMMKSEEFEEMSEEAKANSGAVKPKKEGKSGGLFY